MRLITQVLTAAARSFGRAEPDSRPMAPQSATAQGKPLPQLFNALLAPAATMTANRPLFAVSPLVAAETPHIATRIRAVYANANVQSHAGLCRLKMLRLVEVAVFRSEIAQAIEDAVAADDDLDIANVTPQVVAEMLRRRAVELDDALDSAKEDHRQHDAAARQDAERHRPLRDAVSARFDSLTHERQHIINAIDSIRRAATMEQTAGTLRFHALRSAGLSPAQIAALGPDAQDPDARVDAYRARFAEIESELPALKSFLSDPLLDAAPLAALGLFNELIAARAACEAVSA